MYKNVNIFKNAWLYLLFFLLTACCIVPTVLYSQAPDTLWTRTYTSSGPDLGHSVKHTTDSGYIIAGGAHLLRLDENGDSMWTRVYNANVYSVAEAIDDGFVWTGTCDDSVYVVKTDPSGNTQWSRKYGAGNVYNTGLELDVTDDSHYVIAGAACRYQYPEQEMAIYVLKLDINGDSVWTRAYAWFFGACGYSIQQTSDGNYIVLGDQLGDMCLIKYNTVGSIIWHKTYDFFLSGKTVVRETPDWGYIIVSSGNYNVFVMKTDSSGDSIWTRSYYGQGQAKGHSAVITWDNDYVITGLTTSYGAGDMNVYVLKIRDNGDPVWTANYGGAGSDAGYDIDVTSDSGYVIVGTSNSFGPDNDIYVIRLGPDTLGIEETTSEHIKEFSLHVCPNPFLEKTYISLSTTRGADNIGELPENMELNISDVSGRLVKRFSVTSTYSSVPTSLVWYGTDDKGNRLPAGVYFVTLKACDYTMTEKVLLIR